ncbi:MAG TPA: PepSY-associated TM helix domain-containing protein [Candidatus Angelobacter sp.]|nr:PepSY-associated TM helix domain-containing protein [Candidatus Angelobacter sp.]
MRRLIFNLHLYTALAAAAFVLLMGLTGSIMAFEPEIDRFLHRRIAYVQPEPGDLSLAEIGAIVNGAFPGDRIFAYYLSPSPNLSCQVVLENSGTVYINQHTGKILGVRPDQLEFLDLVHQLHIRLAWRHDGDPGKRIMSWAAVAMLLLLLSGLYLWWPVKRFVITKGAAGRRWWFDLHNSVGIFSFVFLLVLTITGISIGFEQTSNPLFYKLTGSQPSPQPRIPSPPPAATPIPMGQAVEIARKAVPGAAAFALIVPNPTGAYRVLMRFPEDRTPGGRSRVLVDQYTGQVLFAEGSRTAPGGARVTIANRAIHTGDIFGLPSKAVMSLASLMLVLQACSGLVMWWKRTRAKRDVSPVAKQGVS